MSEGILMKTNQQRRSVPILLAVVGLIPLLVSGCMVGPDYHPPHPNAPAAWVGVMKAPAKQPSVATAQPARLTQWWRQFNDPTLTLLVEEAVKTNLDLQLAEARLRQARATRGVVAGALWPAVTASAIYQRERLAGTASGQGVTAAGQGVISGSRDENLYQAGFDAVWELDVFGGLRRNVESANANIQAAIEGISDVQVSLIAEVALNYVQLRGFQQQIVIAQNNLKAQQDTAKITLQRLKAGFVSALDVANADAEVATTESQIPVLEIAAQQSIYALSTLLGRPPADLLKQLTPTGNLPGVPAQVPVGLPSDLLRRRPDIRVAEAQLHAATAQIGVATADLFPKFSLTGSMTWQSNLLQSWWNTASQSFFFGPSATWPIFQGGSIVSNVHVQEALRDQAFITYQKTVLGALQDVENALIAFANEQQHRQSLNDAVVANRKAVDLSMQLYTMGQTDFLNVLNAQRSLYASEDALVQSSRSIATDLIALYKALGGGWESTPSYAQATTPTVANAATETEGNSKY
jgi:NodT family efflux transporter outer membrane factor (OMF) lipoprotein